MDIRVAVLVDGAFFLRRYLKIVPKAHDLSAKDLADNFYTMCMSHVKDEDYLYRILYYDCKPLTKKAHNPITKKAIDFSKTSQAKFRNDFFNELKRLRKVALRLGYIKTTNNWLINPKQTKLLLSGKVKLKDLTENDVFYEMQQKSVDMKIGLDIASLAIKKSVNKIILISGDGDFIPAAKLARREGIDFVLDPMWNNIDTNLFEHIDGLKSTIRKPNNK